MTPISLTDLVHRLDARGLSDRLAALGSLCARRAQGREDFPPPVREPALPSYDHVHSVYSYGNWVQGVCSVAHLVWAAHVNGATSITVIEHESFRHYEEALTAVRIVNEFRGDSPLPLLLGIEIKARIDAQCLPGPAGDLFRRLMLRHWGQDQAAWLVGMGTVLAPEIQRLVVHLQSLKRRRAARQLGCLNSHLCLTPRMELDDLLTQEGNITDRQLCFAVAARLVPSSEPAALSAAAARIRTLLNPGQVAACEYAEDHPGFVESIGIFQRNGLVPFVTAQLKGDDLRAMWPDLQRWGVRGLDTAGIEPEQPGAAKNIQTVLNLAEQHELLLIAGADYRGIGTGWTVRQAWMNHHRVVQTRRRLAWLPSIAASMG